MIVCLRIVKILINKISSILKTNLMIPQTTYSNPIGQKFVTTTCTVKLTINPTKKIFIKLALAMFVLLMIGQPTNAHAQFERSWSDWFTQPDIEGASAMQKGKRSVKEANVFENTDGGFMSMNSKPFGENTTFGGADPGFGFGDGPDTPPDTPIDGGLSILFVAGIGAAIKSMKKNKKETPKFSFKNLLSNLKSMLFKPNHQPIPIKIPC